MCLTTIKEKVTGLQKFHAKLVGKADPRTRCSDLEAKVFPFE